jgi:hypothetical protein
MGEKAGVVVPPVDGAAPPRKGLRDANPGWPVAETVLFIGMILFYEIFEFIQRYGGLNA